jgi:prepilin-type N-terminal cleavage/methylation domain-containing protein
MRHPSPRRGMTLLEIIAALAIAGMALLGGILLLDAVNDDASRIARDGAAQASDGNAAAAVGRMLLETEASFDSTKRFRGSERSLDYFTRCAVPSGWTEPCHVMLAIDSLPDGSAISAQPDGGDRFVFARYAGIAEFRFFDATSRDSSWLTSWRTSATLPSAVAIVVGADTVVLPVGASRD